MTPKEAIEQLESLILNSQSFHEEEGDIWEKDIEALNMAISALEKQIPKKPILKSGESLIHINRGDKPHEWRNVQWQDWTCPECGWFVGQRYNATQCKPHGQRKCNYCNKCGQAIDWGDKE